MSSQLTAGNYCCVTIHYLEVYHNMRHTDIQLGNISTSGDKYELHGFISDMTCMHFRHVT